MTPDVIERAFEPFFTTKPQGEGTGLGLSMIYGFTRQSEGYSKIDSTPERGTTIHLYLPRNHCMQETAVVTEASPTPDQVKAEGRVVLVVEDDEVVRGLVVEILEEYGFSTIQANDGPSGLEILKSKETIDLLVTDIGLPGLNGRQIADAALVERNNLKVLFMTGYAENAASSSGFLRKGMAMITKPFEMKSLINRINELI
jgi:CheY-like chemotaxis protein